uniref:Uncharacterized protein n=1 Tax=Panagrolaimus sp. JU765 TaxID=591449 RepID=A0AC34Q0T4_9BILA
MVLFGIEIETDYYEFKVEQCFDEMIEAVEDAPQSKVFLNVSVNFIESRSDLPQGFLCKDEKAEYGHNYEWKCKSNENKIIKLKVIDVGSDGFDS